jgi:hypothetical protein
VSRSRSCPGRWWSPKLRVGRFQDTVVPLEPGDLLVITMVITRVDLT